MKRLSISKSFIGLWRKRAFEHIESDHFRKHLTKLLNVIEEREAKKSESQKKKAENQGVEEKIIFVNESNPSITIKFKCQQTSEE